MSAPAETLRIPDVNAIPTRAERAELAANEAAAVPAVAAARDAEKERA